MSTTPPLFAAALPTDATAVVPALVAVNVEGDHVKLAMETRPEHRIATLLTEEALSATGDAAQRLGGVGQAATGEVTPPRKPAA
jgi:hypothetical protein